MTTKKGAIILVAIAIILLITSFTLMASDSPAKTTEEKIEESQGSGKVGIDIVPSKIEDKLVEENGK
ncbi:MAG: hypothetical protein WC494_01745 [Candidatus Pacearchaeota archaeon]